MDNIFADSLDEIFLIDTRAGPLSLRHVELKLFFEVSNLILFNFNFFLNLIMGGKYILLGIITHL